jgi:chromatin remodeling complex protein RSC6
MSANVSSGTTKMSTSAKSSKKSTTATAPAKVEAPVVAAPAKTEAPAKVSKKAAAKTEAPAPVAAKTDAPAAVTPVVAPEEDSFSQLNKALARQQEIVAQQKALASEASANLRLIEKLSARVVKKADRKRSRKTAPTSCAFTTPVRISEDLCSFLGKAKGSEVTRSEVTKSVIAYAKSHNLMDKQTIKLDATLRKLLGASESTVVTILNLQTHLTKHYIKDTPASK